MKPGDLVRIVNSSEEKLPDDILGRIGMIVEPVILEDESFIKSWCDWWVMIEGKPETWAEENLQLVNDCNDGYDNIKENP